MASENSYTNALVGAAVSVFLSVVPLSPVLGGATAGYLERRDGGRVGAIAGVFAVLPLLALLVLFGGILFGYLGFGNVFSSILLLLLVGLFVGGYTVTLSAVGGIIGVYLAEEFRE